MDRIVELARGKYHGFNDLALLLLELFVSAGCGVELVPLTLARLLVELAIYKISSFQNIRSARLILAFQRRKGPNFEVRVSNIETNLNAKNKNCKQVPRTGDE